MLRQMVLNGLRLYVQLLAEIHRSVDIFDIFFHTVSSVLLYCPSVRFLSIVIYLGVCNGSKEEGSL